MVAPQYAPVVGGVERHVEELARGLIDRGIDVEVATCDPTGTLPRTGVEGGVPVHRFSTIAHDGAFLISPGLARWVAANARRFDVIHAHSYHTPVAFAAFVGAKLAKRPFVLTPHYHGVGHSPLRRALHVPYRPLGMLMVRGADVIVCVSEAECRRIRKDFGSRLVTTLAPNGVDVDAIASALPFDEGSEGTSSDGPEARRIVVTAGRLEPYKRVDRVIEAMAHLPDHRLVIIGSGPARAGLEEQVARMALQERVAFVGTLPTEDLHRWYRTAAVFVSLSEHEAFGITILEAAVGGAAVVASDIPSHREVSSYVPSTPITLIGAASSATALARAIASSHRRSGQASTTSEVPRWDQTVDRTVAAYELARRTG